MFSSFGRSVPSLKINLISCCLRLMLLPEHCFKPQTMMSSREWEAEFEMFSYECCGGVRWNVHVVVFKSPWCTCNCSDDRKCNTQHSQTDRWSGHVCYVRSSALVEKCEELLYVLARLASRQSAGQWTGIGERRRGTSGVYKDITEVSLALIWHQRGFGKNPACLGIGGQEVFLFVSCTRFPCVRTHTYFCMAWLNPPTEEGPSPKRLVYLNKLTLFIAF